MHCYSLIVEFKKKIYVKKCFIYGNRNKLRRYSCSIIQDDSSGIPKILSNIVSSQFDVHKKFGGVVPDLATRAHVEKIDLIVKEALMKSKKSLNDIDAVALLLALD